MLEGIAKAWVAHSALAVKGQSSLRQMAWGRLTRDQDWRCRVCGVEVEVDDMNYREEKVCCRAALASEERHSPAVDIQFNDSS